MINFDENKDTSVLWSKMSERERLAFLTGFICGEGSFTINNADTLRLLNKKGDDNVRI